MTIPPLTFSHWAELNGSDLCFESGRVTWLCEEVQMRKNRAAHAASASAARDINMHYSAGRGEVSLLLSASE